MRRLVIDSPPTAFLKGLQATRAVSMRVIQDEALQRLELFELRLIEFFFSPGRCATSQPREGQEPQGEVAKGKIRPAVLRFGNEHAGDCTPIAVVSQVSRKLRRLSCLTRRQETLAITAAGRQHRRRSTLDQAARRVACAWDECEGKHRMAGPSCWSKAVGLAAFLATRRRRQQPIRATAPTPRRTKVVGSGTTLISPVE